MDIKKAALLSTKTYYNYATENNKSIVEYPIKQICKKSSVCEFHLISLIPALDNLCIRVDNVVYDDNHFKLLDYDKEKNCVRLIPDELLEGILETARPEQVFLMSDLRFLIKRVEDWYQKYGTQVHLPQNIPTVKRYKPRKMKILPSEDQGAAIVGVLSSPFTYVWGAPGTGKTQVVLAQCILSYLKRNKRILITAPTNRAVEQILYGILPILESVGIRQDAFLRLGIPTKEFVQEYPDICENEQLLRKLEEIDIQIKNNEKTIQENKKLLKLHRQYHIYAEYRARFELQVSQIFQLLDLLKKTEKDKQLAEEKCSLIKAKRRSYESKFENINSQMEVASKKICALNKQLQKYESGIYHLLFPKKAEEYRTQLDDAVTAHDLLENKKSSITELLEKNKKEQEQAETNFKNLTSSYENHLKNLEKQSEIFSELHLTKSSLSFKPSFDKAELLSLIHAGKQLFEEKARIYEPINNLDFSALIAQNNRLISDQEKLLESQKMHKNQHRIRMDKCLVIATTIDVALFKVLPDGDFLPEHVFLDEAGYAPLIKAATLTAYNCPLTLLGDHMQLPPVCEINDNQLEEDDLAPAVFWAQSALYLEDLFFCDLKTIHRKYLEHVDPFFEKLKKFDLLHSYRFGSSLASILAGEVYSLNLKGNEQHQTKIMFVHVPHKVLDRENYEKSKNSKRYNAGECDAIAKFVQKYDDLEIGVITPYRNQKNALRKQLPHTVEVNTVHGSQGREWDCVVLSVVDSTDMFFTNSLSKISNGKNIINTAVSRAKKFLVIVCDADFWKSQNRQLIGKLISIGQELKL